MAYHPRATPNFRNLVVRPMWITLRAGLRTIPYIGPRFFSQDIMERKLRCLMKRLFLVSGNMVKMVRFMQQS